MIVRVPFLLFVLAASAAIASAPSAWAQQTRPSSTQALARTRTPLSEIAGINATSTAPAALNDEADDEAENRELVEQARAALEDGRNDEAARQLLEAIRGAKSERAEPRRLLAIALERLGQIEPALRYATAAAALSPRSVDTQSLAGTLLLRIGRPDDAIPHLRSATLAAEAEPDNPNATFAWYALGECLRQGGYALAAAEAYAAFDKAVFDTHPEHANAERVRAVLADSPRGALFHRVELLKQLSLDKDLDRLTADALKRWPDDPNVARCRVLALVDSGRPADAFEFAKASLADRAAQGVFLPLALDAAGRAGVLDAWLGEMEAAIRAGDAPAYAAETVRLLNRLGKGEAAAGLGQALVAAGGSSDLLWDVAIGQVLAGKLGAGVDIVADIARRLPAGRDLPAARVNAWCAAVRSTGDFAARLPGLRQREPRDYAVDFVLGMTAAGIDEPGLAEGLLSACLSAKADFAPALTVRGRMLLSRYKWDEAKAEARALLKGNPELAAAWIILAEAHDGLDEHAEAQEAYRKALRFGPDEPLYRLAAARHYAQRPDGQLSAQRYFQEALELDPQCSDAYEGLLDSYIREGKIELTKELWREMQSRSLPDDVLRRAGTTVRFFETGKLFSPEHVVELQRQYADHPTDAAVSRRLAEALAGLGRTDEARKICEEALAHWPEDYELLMTQAELCFREIQYDRAAYRLEDLVKRFPNREIVLRRLAMAYRYDFRTQECRAVLRRLADRPDQPRNNPDRTLLYRSYLEFGEFDEANRLLDELLKDTPDDPILLAQKLDNLVTAKRGDEAFAIVSKRLADAPDDESVRELFLSTAATVGRYAEGEEKLREWMKGDENAYYAEKLVDLLMRAKKLDAALAAAKKFPDTSWPLSMRRRLLLARVDRAMGNVTAAISEFDGIAESRAIGSDQQVALQREVLLALCDDGQFDAALARCDKWLKDAGGTPEARFVYLRFKSFVFQAAGRDEEYLENLESLWALSPNDPTYNNDLGYAWVDAGRNLDRALPMIRKAVSVEPMIHAYLDSLGWAYYKSGDFASARKYLERASKLFTGHDPDVLDHLGDAEWRLGDKDSAVNRWREARKLLEEVPDSEKLPPDQVRLLASVRAKLSAVENRQPPPVAAVVDARAGADK